MRLELDICEGDGYINFEPIGYEADTSDLFADPNSVEIAYRYESREVGWGAGADEYVLASELANAAEGMQKVLTGEESDFACALGEDLLTVSAKREREVFSFRIGFLDTLEREKYVTVEKQGLSRVAFSAYVEAFKGFAARFPVRSQLKAKKLILFMGIPASGKTTFYRARFSDLVHINLDTLHTRTKERELFAECLANGRSVVVDNTNPTRADRARYIPLARAAGYEVVGYFFQSVIADCVARNAKREGKARVPDTAIACISGKLEMPTYAEGFDKLFFIRFGEEGQQIDEWRE